MTLDDARRVLIVLGFPRGNGVQFAQQKDALMKILDWPEERVLAALRECRDKNWVTLPELPS